MRGYVLIMAPLLLNTRERTATVVFPNANFGKKVTPDSFILIHVSTATPTWSRVKCDQTQSKECQEKIRAVLYYCIMMAKRLFLLLNSEWRIHDKGSDCLLTRVATFILP
jgi:hypothetical protein